MQFKSPQKINRFKIHDVAVYSYCGTCITHNHIKTADAVEKIDLNVFNKCKLLTTYLNRNNRKIQRYNESGTLVKVWCNAFHLLHK